MEKLLVVIDMQNDFITGALGSPEAAAIVPYVNKKITAYKSAGHTVIFTRDTHLENYLETQEGQNLPVKHCLLGTEGHEIAKELNIEGCQILNKPAFGDIALAEHIAKIINAGTEIELCGLCSDICVVSNALILKARLPENKITVDARATAGVSEKTHQAALLTMKTCQINVINE